MWAQLAKRRPTVIEQAANANATQEMEQMPNNSDPAPKGQLHSSSVPFTGPYKEEESPLYLAFTTLYHRC